MNSRETMIDGTAFGIIAGYLHNPRSPIEYILHVRDRAMLPELAARIERDALSGASAGRPFSPELSALVRDGTVKVSSRHGTLGLAPEALVEVKRVQQHAFTEVIYLPPFYLAHTPGLFEGKVMSNDPAAQQRANRGYGYSY